MTEGFVPLPAPGGADVNVTTQFQYTAVGQVAAIIDPLLAVTQFEYDAVGRTIEETNPLGQSTQFDYDDLGRPVQRLDAKGQSTSYQYTSRSDVSVIDYPTGPDTTFLYDATQNMIAMTDSIGASGWIFDAADRMTKQTDSLGEVLECEYDTTGAQTGLTLPGGQTVGFEYDDAGRPILETSPWGSLAYGYDAASNLTAALRSTGVTSEYEYDANNRVTGIDHTSPGSELGCDLGAHDIEVGAGVDIEDLIDLEVCLTVDIDIPVLTGLDYGDSIELDYSYDQVGNVASQTRKDGSAAAVTTSYGYDALHRLTSSSSTDAVNNTYQYDKAGNRTKWVTNKAPDTGAALTANATYNAAGQLTNEARTRPGLLGSVTVNTTHTYDANGNRTKSQTGAASTTYKYTADDKLAEVNQAGRKVTTDYDGLGRALSETTQTLLILGSTTTQVWDGLQVVQQDSPLIGTRNLIRDVTGDVAIQTGGLLAGGTKWGLTDRLGSTIAQTSGSKVGQLARYSDWGVPTFATLGWTSATGYTGELGDTTAGLNHYFARSYQPMTGTWLSADPYRGTMSDPGSLGRYGYVEGNPSTFADLLGYRAHMLHDGGGEGKWGKPSGRVGGKTILDRCTSHGCNAAAEPRAPGSDSSRNSARHGATCGTATTPDCGLFGWSADVWQNIGAIAGGIAIGVIGTAALAACIAATAGICAGVAAGAAVFMIGGAAVGGLASTATYHWSTGPKDGWGYANAAFSGMVFGSVTAGIGPVIGGALRAGQLPATSGAATGSAGASPASVGVGPRVGTVNPSFQFPGAGRGGTGVKDFVGPPNSVVKGASEGRVFVTDANGRVILDITRDRVKPVVPGQGFVSGDTRKSLPTQEQLDWIDELWG